ARYIFDKENGCIEIYQIPPTTTIEAIVDKIIDFVKQGKIKEISDIRDETDLSGLKIAIDVKRGQDPEKLMQKLFKMTSLEDSFACNFNILIGNTPKTLGVREILSEWIAFRKECVKRRVYFDLNKKKDKLHLLLGLSKILLDIDKAIKIVRETPKEDEVIPNLMIGFGIDQIQADFVAEIKLRNLNKEYIMKKISEVDSLKSEIADAENILANE
ncbi:MAG: DNA gyrase subunit A, partial [Oscillospiraceae bacterium]